MLDIYNDKDAALPLSERQEKRLIEQVEQEYFTDRDQMQAWATEAKGLQAAALGGRGPTRKNTPWPGCSNVDIPMTRTACKGIFATIFAAYFSQYPFIRFPPDNKETEDFIEWQIEKEMRARPKFADWLFNAIYCGTGVGMVQPGRNAKGEFILEMENIDHVDDFFIPDSASGPDAIRDAHHCGLRTHPQLWELFDMQRLGIFKNVQITDGIPKEATAEGSQIEQAKLTFEKAAPSNRYIDRMQDTVTMLRWYTKFQMGPADGNPEPDEPFKDIIVWMAVEPCRKIYRVVENADNVRPFFYCVYDKVPGRFHGHGVPKGLMQVQEQINLIYNMRNDAGQIAIQPFGFYDPMSGLKPEEVAVGPGRMIPTDQPEKVNIVKPFPLPTHMFEEEDRLTKIAERDTGAGDLLLGAGIQGAGTATGVRSILQQGSLRMDVQMIQIGWGLYDFVSLVIYFNKKFRKKPVVVRVTGSSEEVSLLPEKISKFDERFIPHFDVNSLTGNKAAEREMTYLAHDKLMMNPLVQGDAGALFGAAQMIANFTPFKRPDSLLPTMYLKMMDAQKQLTSADQENQEFAYGKFCSASWMDDDLEHMQKHRMFREASPQPIRELVDAHMEGHLYNMRYKALGATSGILPHTQVAAPTPEEGGGQIGAPSPAGAGPSPTGSMSAPMGPQNPMSTEYRGEPGVIGPPQPGGPPVFPQAIQELGRPE
jgi:hypothetical protein